MRMTAETTIGKSAPTLYMCCTKLYWILICLLNIITRGKMMNEKPDDGSQRASPTFKGRLSNEEVFVSCFMPRDPLLMDNRP